MARLTCRRCAHTWEPRTELLVDRLPRRCPRCGSYKWNEPRKRDQNKDRE